MQAAGADVFSAFIDLIGDLGDALNAVTGIVNLQPFRVQKRLILARQRRRRFGENTLKIVWGERAQLNANRQAPLQLGDKIRGFCKMKRPRGNEQNMVCFYHAIFGGDG